MLSAGSIVASAALFWVVGATTLEDAIAQFNVSRFDLACPELSRLATEPASRDASQRARLQKHLGLCAVIEDRPEQAVQHFVAALRADPELRFSSALQSPEVIENFRRAQEVILSQDSKPPQITHEPPAAGQTGRRIDIEAVVADEHKVVFVRIDYRAQGESGFRSTFMEHQTSGRYLGSIPSFAVQAPSVQYSIVATDVANNIAQHPKQGSLSISVDGPPPAASPWYTKWWVWTAVGAVVAGSAAATAVVLTRDKPATVSVDNPFSP